MRRIRPTAAIFAAISGLLFGSGATALWSAEKVRALLPDVAELQPIARLDPVRALPRTAIVLAMAEARSNLEAGRAWTAWTALRDFVEQPEDASASTVLLAAQAAAGWGGWDHVRELLDGREWLDEEEGGAGWFLLGRAEEEAEHWSEAAAAYRRAAALSSGRPRGITQARLGGVLNELDDERGAGAAYEAAAQHLPQIADWLSLLAYEAHLEAGGTAAARAALPTTGNSGAVRVRRARAITERWAESGRIAAAAELLTHDVQALTKQGLTAEAAMLTVDRARLLDVLGRTSEARDLLRSVAWEPSVPARVRAGAAELLGEIVSDRAAAEELARAAAYEAADRPELAARSLEAAIEAGARETGALRFRLGKLHFDARDYGAGREEFLAAADRLADPEMAAEARLYAARALYRRGNRSGGLAELERLAERWPRTAAAGTALFLLGDASARMEPAIALYRRAAAIRHSPHAREALFRVGDRELKTDDPAAAIRAWEAYVARYPRGDETARVAFQTGLLHEEAGRDAQARAMYTAATAADPLSYYAVRAANRLGVDPLGRLLEGSRPWLGTAADAAATAAVLDRLELLQEAGLAAAWDDELEAAERRFADSPAALLSLAEGLRDQGHAFDAILLGREIYDLRGAWDERLLRVVFPLPYRSLIEREADRADTDPLLLAALIRQESMFRTAANSWVGAVGLGQVMPSTGRWMASKLDIEGYETQLLEVPEVNLRLSARYLADLMDRYDGARDLALAAYNAGPGRADRWRGELNYEQDVDAFREAIPFDETRHYVKIVLRNYAVYQRLYGEPRAPGLVSTEW